MPDADPQQYDPMAGSDRATHAEAPPSGLPLGPASSTPHEGSLPGPRLRASDLRSPRRRRIWLPLALFLATCLSTFWAGAKHWAFLLPVYPIDERLALRWLIVSNWAEGLTYMAALIAILFAHEMGHFLTSVWYRIPASLPFFIPLPISPIGTMGAVIAMAGMRANRRQIFDIGIAGPLAGLVVLFPVLIVGIQQLDLTIPRTGGVAFDCPLAVRLVMRWIRPDLGSVNEIWVSQLNAPFMAAWVGLLVTGLNMLPISQLDGGHVIYALMRKRAHWVARTFLLLAIVYVSWSKADIWLIMVVLVILIGVDHPPTADDDVPLGPVRTILGWASLAIPLLCFPPRGFTTFF